MNRALAAAVWIALAAASAHAQPSGTDHYEAGKRLFAARRYAEAIDEFRRALAIAPRPEVLYSIAQSQRLLGDCPGAIETYHAFLAARPDEQLAEYARANIERCEAELRAAPRAGPPVSAAAAVEERPPGSRSTVELGDRKPSPGQPTRAWYQDALGDALVASGLVLGAAGAVVWHAGRSAASEVAGAPDYQTFVARRSSASSALTEQQIGVAAMLVGSAVLVGGVVHYVHAARAAPRTPAVGVALTAGAVMVTGCGAF